MIKFIQSLRILPRWMVILLDILVLLASGMLGYLLRFNFELAPLITFQFEKGIAIFALAHLAAIFFTQSYAGIIRYTTLQDGLRIVTTTTLGALFTMAINFASLKTNGELLIPYSVSLIAYFVSTIFLFSYRLVVKYVYSYFTGGGKRKHQVLIFGAGSSGIITKQIIDYDPSSSVKVVGFVEDDSNKIGKVISGVHIYSSEKDFEGILQEGRINEVIISVQNLPISRKNEIVDTCLKYNVKVRYVPPANTWVKGELSLKQIKEVNIEDLLGRESINLEKENVQKEISGKIILITGAAGSIGSELVRQVINYAPELVILLDQSESGIYDLEAELKIKARFSAIQVVVADITDYERMEELMTQYQPQIIYHAAAYKHVPLMEKYPYEAVKTNVLGTKNLADLAVKYQVEKFVMISTDKAVNPTNVMGASKRIAEIYVQSLNNHLLDLDQANTHFITTRFGNVLGSQGSVIPLFKKQIASGGPITVTHPDVTRYFMTIPEACQLVLEAGAMGNGGEIFIFDMGASVKILDLAHKMLKLSGMIAGRDIEIVFTGLREGEKLYEELLGSTENTLPTHHPKIMIAQVGVQPFLRVKREFEAISNLLPRKDDMEIVTWMKMMVPEFLSNSSRFEILDKKKKILG